MTQDGKPVLPSLNLSENSVAQALNSVKIDQNSLKVNKLTMEIVNSNGNDQNTSTNTNDQRQLSPRSPRRLHQLNELKEDTNLEYKPRLRRISQREKNSESSTSTRTTATATTTTTTTTTTSTTSTYERSLHVASSGDISPMKRISLMNSSFDSSLEQPKGTTAYENQYKEMEKTTDKISSMIKELNEIKSLQDQRNQQIIEKNKQLVLLCNQRRQKNQKIYHHNYLVKKAFLRKKYINELNYLYKKRQRDIEILQLEQKKRRQAKYIQLKKQMKQQKLRKARLLQIQQREAQIQQVQAYYLKKREIQKEKLLLLSMNSKVMNYSQTEDPSNINDDDYYSDDYSDIDEQETGADNIQERGIIINLEDDHQQIKGKETQETEKSQLETEKNISEKKALSNDTSAISANESDLSAQQATERSSQLDSNNSDFSDLLTKGAICFVLAATIFRAFQVAF